MNDVSVMPFITGRGILCSYIEESKNNFKFLYSKSHFNFTDKKIIVFKKIFVVFVRLNFLRPTDNSTTSFNEIQCALNVFSVVQNSLQG